MADPAVVKATKTKPSEPKKPNKEAVAAEEGSSAMIKLLLFSLLIIIVPLAGYFGSLYWVFSPEEPIKAAVVSIVSANVLLALYVWMAYREEQLEQLKAKRE